MRRQKSVKLEDKTIAMVGLRQVEAEQVKHADDEVKLARNAQIEEKIRHEILRELARRRHLGRSESDVVIDERDREEGESHPRSIQLTPTW